MSQELHISTKQEFKTKIKVMICWYQERKKDRMLVCRCLGFLEFYKHSRNSSCFRARNGKNGFHILTVTGSFSVLKGIVPLENQVRDRITRFRRDRKWDFLDMKKWA